MGEKKAYPHWINSVSDWQFSTHMECGVTYRYMVSGSSLSSFPSSILTLASFPLLSTLRGWQHAGGYNVRHRDYITHQFPFRSGTITATDWSRLIGLMVIQNVKSFTIIKKKGGKKNHKAENHYSSEHKPLKTRIKWH